MTLKQLIRSLMSISIVCCMMILGGIPVAQADAVAEGQKIAFDRKKGNCMTCHMMAGTTLAGNIGPPLIAMKARYPDKARLRAQIWDPSATNPNSIMPPFGLHRILTEKEIDLVTEYIHSL